MNRESIACAYDRYAAPLYRFLCGFLGNREDAADAVHNTFLNLARRGVEGISDLESYLWTAARNEARGMVRRKARPYLLPKNGHPVDPTQRMHVESILALLPEAQREVVLLHGFEGLTFRETGDRLGISLETAASRFHYALQKLEGLL